MTISCSVNFFLQHEANSSIFATPLDGMPVYHKLLPNFLSGFPNSLSVPIYTAGWREGASKVSCPR